MAKPKRKTLPKNFEELLEKGDLHELKAVFDHCLLDARGGIWKQTALGFDECPHELAAWLVAQGLDVQAAAEDRKTPLHNRACSRNGNIESLLKLGADVNHAGAPIGTPLHAAARYHQPANARLLLQYGAAVDAVNNGDRLTPLELALQTCANADIQNMVEFAEVLLNAGAQKTEKAREFVVEIGKSFEFHRENFNPDDVDETSAALDKLYALLGVAPVPRRMVHDGKAPIVMPTGEWQDQHQALWELLVPSNGAAATVQGEVIRASGRIFNEMEGNGGINWDKEFRKMADAFAGYLQQGVALSPAEVAEAAALARHINQTGDSRRLCELAVAWVRANPTPIALARPAYKR